MLAYYVIARRSLSPPCARVFSSGQPDLTEALAAFVALQQGKWMSVTLLPILEPPGPEQLTLWREMP